MASERGHGVIAEDREARSIVNGRPVNLLVYTSRSGNLEWHCGARWSTEMTKRQRKDARKRRSKIVEAVLDPDARSALRIYCDAGSATPVEDAMSIGTGGLGFGGQGEPPPADEVVSIVELLDALAARIERILQ
jgi:hypothetical protein